MKTSINPALPTCILMDSGVGGLSVLNTLLRFNIPLNFIYVADTAFMPYGSKSVPVLRSHLVQLFTEFETRWGLATPIALCCNTASVVMAHLPWQPAENNPAFNLLDIITPTIESIAGYHQPKKSFSIGVLATELTIQSGVYPQLLKKHNVDLTAFYGIACPQLAASIEGQPTAPAIETLLEAFLAPLQHTQHPLDAVILGCTHYQFVAESIQKRLPTVPLLSQSLVMAQKIAASFNLSFSEHSSNAPSSDPLQGSVTLLSTGNPELFQPLVPQFLPAMPLLTVQSF
jgi:glutamate racemase